MHYIPLSVNVFCLFLSLACAALCYYRRWGTVGIVFNLFGALVNAIVVLALWNRVPMF